MHVSNNPAPNAQAMQMLRQSMDSQEQMAEQMIQMSVAQENVQQNDQILGMGVFVDFYA